MKKMILLVLMVGALLNAPAQARELPLTEWNVPGSDKFIFYISGDGGMNRFSRDICMFLSQSGYSVAAMDASIYFARSKTPEQTAAAIASYITKQMKLHHYSQLFMAGYSLGADVMPFVVIRFPDEIRKRLDEILLISPSLSTDFEIHLADQLGFHTEGKLNVIAEINKLIMYKVSAFFGIEEENFPVQKINLKSFHFKKLPGGHHYDDKPLALSNAMIDAMK